MLACVPQVVYTSRNRTGRVIGRRYWCSTSKLYVGGFLDTDEGTALHGTHAVECDGSSSMVEPDLCSRNHLIYEVRPCTQPKPSVSSVLISLKCQEPVRGVIHTHGYQECSRSYASSMLSRKRVGCKIMLHFVTCSTCQRLQCSKETCGLYANVAFCHRITFL